MTAAKVLKMDNEKATLEIGGNTIELPTIVGSEGEVALDISKLRATTKAVTLDNGFVNTGSCESAVTFLDGEKGILRYRGYPIEQLAEKSSFLEVAYLLYNGELPTEQQFSAFKSSIDECGNLPKGVTEILKTFPKETHPMAALASLTSILPGFFPNIPDQNHTPEQRDQMFALLIGAYKQLTANIYRHTSGKNFIAADSSKNYCSDFLGMMLENDDPAIAEALDTLLILHADHEQNCSASTVRLVGSSHAHPFAAISAGVSALWGPLHGGANQAVLEMLEQIQKDGGDYKNALAMAKDKNSNFRLMGFGHRVYKNFDPRAKIIKKSCDTILTNLGVSDPLLDIARGLEEEALKDSYFVERKLYPNVDFYSGIIYRALGIPTNMFTVMFALGRLPGWMAQWKEMIESKSTKIGRPRQIYTGATERDYPKK